MKKILIYGLVSTEDVKIIKYIGKTHQKTSKRIHDHIRESYKLKTKKDEWIQLVIKNGYNVTYCIIEECDETNWLSREKYWISKVSGLTNSSKGGDGGRGLIATKSFDELREFSHKHMVNVKNSIDWVKFVVNNPQYKFLPKYPQASYKHRGWTSWDDLLVNYSGNKSNKRNCNRLIVTYNECKKIISNLKIKDSKEWRLVIKSLGPEIPTAPDKFYSKTNEWVSWGDFLGNNNISNKRKEFLNYFDAKLKIKKYNFKNRQQYSNFIKMNGLIDGIPYNPHRFYSKTKEWISWVEFLL